MCFSFLKTFVPLFFILISSCGWLDSKKSFNPNAIVVEGKVNCFNQFSKSLKNYVNGKLSPQETEYYISCIQNSFVEYLKHVEGESRDFYTDLEIKNFLETYYLIQDQDSSKEITEGLLRVTMGLKKGLLGGSESQISKRELKTVIELLDRIKVFAVEFLPYTSLLFFDSQRNQTDYETDKLIDEGFLVIRRFKSSFVDLINKVPNKSYSLSSLESLVLEYHKYFYKKNNENIGASVKKTMIFFKAFKKLVVGGDESLLSSEWEDLLGAMISSYESLLRYRRIIFKNHKSIFYGVGLKNVNRISQQSLEVLGRGVERHKKNYIPFDEVYDVVKSYSDITESKLLGVSLENSFPLFKKWIKKSFGNRIAKPEKRDIPGINSSVVRSLKKEYKIWYNVQSELQNSYLKNLYTQSPYVQNSYRQGPYKSPKGVRVSDMDPLGREVERAFIEIKNVGYRFLDNCRSENKSQCDGVTVTDSPNEVWKNSKDKFDNYSFLNIFRLASRFLIRGYSQDSQRAFRLEGLKSSELQSFYEDFRAVGVELQTVNPTVKTAGLRSFIEGSLFLPTSKGIQIIKRDCEEEQNNTAIYDTEACKSIDSFDSILSFSEIIDLVSYSYSSNSKGKKIYALLVEKCGMDLSEKGVYGLGSIKKDECFDRHSSSIFLQELKNMRLFYRDISETLFQEQQEYFKFLLSALHQPEYSKDHLEMGEIVNLVGVLQYIESIMIQFDKNKDRLISGTELLNLYSRMETFLEDKLQDHRVSYIDLDLKVYDLNWSAKLSAAQRENIFYYMLKHQSNPGFSLLFWDMDWNPFKVLRPDTYSIRLDHKGLMKSFVGLMQLLGPQ